MKRTLALTMIVKNEVHNLPVLFESLKGCIDKAYITDTGSTDGTIEWLKDEAELVIGCPVEVFHFPWINDFAAARNHNLPYIKEDYTFWQDADDSLSDRNAFIKWKESTMGLFDYWMAPYDYGFDDAGNVACSFGRERIFLTSKGYRFQDFLHEGVVPFKDSKPSMVASWRIIHRRTKAEADKDISRNLLILEEKRSMLTPRLTFYLGKEYFDNEKYEQAEEVLLRVIKYKEEELDKGDRILAHQYLVHAYLRLSKFDKAIKYGLASLYLDPERAEFYCFLADAYAAQGNLKASIPYYMAAKSCNPPPAGYTKIFHAPVCYFYHPTMRLAQVYFNLGELDMAIHELSKLDTSESKEFLEYCKKMYDMQDISRAMDNDDIVISCMPGPYRWDENIYATTGLGGSETAAVEMAKHLASQTNRKVIVFNDRDEPLHMKHGALGVEYRPSKEAMEYFKKWKPKIHIAWRHNIKLTDAKTYLWCHDLVTPGAENTSVYEKIICLSDFHKNYVQSCQAIPDEKIWISRNGIEPARFFKEMPKRQYGKVIWSNSPDRGLEHAIDIMDKVHEQIPMAELHIFYGWENLYKYGLAEKADMLKAMVEARPWIKYVGNVDQARLTREVASSDVWIYPATFIESYCISALESLCCGTWSVARDIGALHNTLAEAKKLGMCDLVDIDPTTIEGKQEYARLVIEAIIEQKHDRVKVDPKKFAWASVASEWIKEMDL